MNDKIKKEPALKVDNGFKISMLCLESDQTTEEQKLSIARSVKSSLERAKRIIAKSSNSRLFMNISKEEQNFVNQFLPADEQLNVV